MKRTTTTSHQDASDELKARICAVRKHPRGWASWAAVELIRDCTPRLATLATRQNLEPDEAVSYAWELWRADGVLAAEDAWSYTLGIVYKKLVTEREAAQKRTSTYRLTTDDAAFVQATDFCTDGLAAFEYDEIAAPSDAEPVRFTDPSLLTAAGILRRLGHSDDVADAAVEAMVESAVMLAVEGFSARKQLATASERVSRDRGLPAALGIDRKTWTTLCRLVLGTENGGAGLLIAARTGLDIDSVDPADRPALRNIRNASRNLKPAAA